MLKENQRYGLYQGDCRDYMKTVPDNSVQLLLTDIPYGEVNKPIDNGFGHLIRQTKEKADQVNFELESLIREFCRIVARDGTMCVFCGSRQLSTILTIMEEEGFSTRMIALAKSNPTPFNARVLLQSAFEIGAWGKRNGATFNRHCVSNIFTYPTSKAEDHPTPKPLGLFKELIELSTNPGDIVADPMFGSGTCGIAALSLGRRFWGCEIDPEWFKSARKKIEEAADSNIDSVVFTKVKSSRIRFEKWKHCNDLAEEGYSKSRIAKVLNLDWKTVDKYLAMTEADFVSSSAYHRDYSRKLDGYEHEIREKLKNERKISCAHLYRWFKETYPDVEISQNTMYNYVQRLKKNK